LVWLAACAATDPNRDVLGVLERAERHLQAGDADTAEAALDQLDQSDFRDEPLERFILAQAKVHQLRKEWWDGFMVLRRFLNAQEFRFNKLEPDMRRLIFELGESLLASDGGFLFFSNDVDDGITVYEYFYVRFPEDRERMPDVLYRLGEEAYQRRQWNRAIERYRALIEGFSQPRHEWIDKADYRLAICHRHRVRGWEFDLRTLREAYSQLRGYLANAPRNPDYVREAELALGEVTDMLAQRELETAEFYYRIGKPDGRRLHLNKALQYADTPQAREAGRLLDQELGNSRR
jgi:outer membrane protein assembly factor BamD (BamD/ComL family)